MAALDPTLCGNETSPMAFTTGESAAPPPRRSFQTTSWTVVAAASLRAPQSRAALEQLCRTYWQPLVSFLRRSTWRLDSFRDAEDAVQSFFAWLIESNALERADANRGRFRTFLLSAFQQFLSREQTFWAAQKRRPDGPIQSLAQDSARVGLRGPLDAEPYHELTPERLFDYTWAIEVLERAKTKLREEWTQAGRAERFAVLKVHFTGGQELSGKELARQLGMSEGAARVALCRLKQQFAALVREEVAQTVDSEEEIDAELAYLREALRITRR